MDDRESSDSDTRHPGSAPGVLEADPAAPDASLSLMAFDDSDFVEAEIDSIEALDRYRDEYPRVWLNVDGVGDVEVLREVGERFSLPNLVLEDVQNVPQRPRAAVVEDRLFLVTLMPRPGDDPLTLEQVSIVKGERVVVTFQEYHGGDVLDPVRNRIRAGTGRIRRSGTDYLTYAILDAIVDSFYPLIESLNEELDELERDVLAQSGRDAVADIYEVKVTLQRLEHAARPQRAMITTLNRGESAAHFTGEVEPYLQDCMDHAVQVSELADATRQTAGSLMELNLSLASHRMNEVMKVLTIIATVFIPLTFIAGIYGMNFDPAVSPWNMPETQWRYGYPAVMIAMLILGLLLLGFFYRRGWLGGAD